MQRLLTQRDNIEYSKVDEEDVVNIDESSSSWLDTLANATGWLNPFQLVQSRMSKIIVGAFAMTQLMPSAVAGECVSSDYFSILTYYPMATVSNATYYIRCHVANQASLFGALAEKCNVTFLTPIDSLSFSDITSLYVSNIRNNGSWIPACIFFSPVKFLEADTCILNVLSTIVINECKTANITQAVATVGVLFGALAALTAASYGVYKIASIITTPADVPYGPEFRPPLKSLTRLAADAVSMHPHHAAFFQACVDDHPHKMLVGEARERLSNG